MRGLRLKIKGYWGFTLLELLIAVTIFSIAAVAIYTSFNVGIRAWRKAENSYKIKQEARYAFNTIARELRNAISFTVEDSEGPLANSFDGSSNEVSFWKALKITSPKDGYSEGIYKITYSFDEEAKTLYYILRTYKESLTEEDGNKSLLTSGVSDFKLEYAYKDGEEIVWDGRWKEQGADIPFGVKVHLTYLSQSEGEVVEFSETIFIPTGTLKDITEIS